MPIRTDYTTEFRALVYGLAKGLGGVAYTNAQISKLVKDQFNIEIDETTVRNWKSDMDSEMKKHGITEDRIKDTMLQATAGKLKLAKTLPEAKGEAEGPPKPDPYVTAYSNNQTKETKTVTPPQQQPVTFKSDADAISYIEGRGYTVLSGQDDFIAEAEKRNLRVIDAKQNMFTMRDLYIKPLELDIEAVGRNIVGNPIIQMYFGLQRMNAPDTDLAAWITACVIDTYNRRGIQIAVLRS